MVYSHSVQKGSDVAASYADIQILLVEDFEPDAVLLREKLRLRHEVSYTLSRVRSMAEAREWLGGSYADVILLDMNLGDSAGLDTVSSMVDLAEESAVVVLTGIAERELALRALEYGAQDFLVKDEVNARALQRVLLYAVYRRKAQVRAFKRMLASYRDLADDSAVESQAQPIEKAPSPIKDSAPAFFRKARRMYDDLLGEYLECLVVKRSMPEFEVEPLVKLLGQAGAGPRDVLDIHISALEAAVKRERPERAQYLNTDGRLLALKVMGALLSFYRQRAAPGSGQAS